MIRLAFILLFCTGVRVIGVAQQSKSEYINMELSILEQRLSPCGDNCLLTNVQIGALQKIWAEKADKVLSARQAFISKDDLSAALRAIEAEFIPRVTSILTMAQRKYALPVATE